MWGETVIRILFKQALDEKSFREGRRITLNEVSEKTGISRPTLTRISNTPGYNTNTDTVGALCDYFEIEPGELLKKV
jgi:putative transcriptional regulator